MFLMAAFMSLSLTQDPIPMRMTQEEFGALEACVGASRNPVDCGIADDVSDALICFDNLPSPVTETTTAWVAARTACIDALTCNRWVPASGQTDTLLLLEACGVREWGVLKALSAIWLERVRAEFPEAQFAQVLDFEERSADRIAELEAVEQSDLAADRARRVGRVRGVRRGGWGTVLFVYQITLLAAQGELLAEDIARLSDAWVESP